MIDKEIINKNKNRFIDLLKSTNREGIANVLNFLEEKDFYNIPSSLGRHHNWDGGLVQHCLGVYDRLIETGEKLDDDSKILVALLHDICKAGKIYKNKKGQWSEKIDKDLAYPGHGERSVKILADHCGLKLNEEEKKAIRWHMGGFMVPKNEIRDFYATKKSDLWRLLHNADRYDASHNGK